MAVRKPVAHAPRADQDGDAESHRPLAALGDSFRRTIGIVAIAFGAILGALASFQGVAWPTFALVVLNVLAALYTHRLRDARG